MNREQEFLELIELHKGILYKVTRMYTDDESQKDLFQEILFQLWRSFPRFKKESTFSTWMYRVALNTAITIHKKTKRRSESEGLAVFDYTSDNTNENSKIELFYKAVQQLSTIEKAVIFLFLENYSHKEIGKNLGISEGNARVRLSRAKNKLKDILKKYEHEF